MASLLLVEDEQHLRWALRTRLVRAGHQVVEAATLGEAETFLKQQRPQVVILDVNLPDGNGIDFLAAQREKLAGSAVLVFTADDSIPGAVKAMKLGTTDFHSKPVDHEELIRLVSATLAIRASSQDEQIIPLEEVEFIMVQRALRAAHGNQSQAARLLQVSRDQLRYRVKRYREMGRLSAELVAEEAN